MKNRGQDWMEINTKSALPLRLACFALCASVRSACSNTDSNAVSLPSDFLRLYLGGMSPGALSHFLTVFLASPVLLQISPSESWSRNFMRRTLPIMSMVITFYIPAESFSRAVEHPCQIWIGTLHFTLSIFGRRQQIGVVKYAIGESASNRIWLEFKRDPFYDELVAHIGDRGYAEHGGLTVNLRNEALTPDAFHSTLTIGAIQYIFHIRLSEPERQDLLAKHERFCDWCRTKVGS